jgi:hypothetical protein
LNPCRGLAPGQIIQKGEVFAGIGDTDVNGGWPPHLHFQIITDLLGESGNFPGVARPSQRRVWQSLCPNPNLILNIPASRFKAQGRSKQEILAFRKTHIGRNLSVSYDNPLKIVKGEAQYLFSEDGQVYVDGVNNVSHVGHCHPEVVRAGQRQMAVLNTNTRYLHDNIIEYAQRLLSTFPDPLSVCFFVCTGSEANELAFRLARTYTNRTDIISLAGSYHGNTNLLIDVSPYKHDGPGGKGKPAGVETVVMPDGYRGPIKAAITTQPLPMPPMSKRLPIHWPRRAGVCLLSYVRAFWVAGGRWCCQRTTCRRLSNMSVLMGASVLRMRFRWDLADRDPISGPLRPRSVFPTL